MITEPSWTAIFCAIDCSTQQNQWPISWWCFSDSCSINILAICQKNLLRELRLSIKSDAAWRSGGTRGNSIALTISDCWIINPLNALWNPPMFLDRNCHLKSLLGPYQIVLLLTTCNMEILHCLHNDDMQLSSESSPVNTSHSIQTCPHDLLRSFFAEMNTVTCVCSLWSDTRTSYSTKRVSIPMPAQEYLKPTRSCLQPQETSHCCLWYLYRLLHRQSFLAEHLWSNPSWSRVVHSRQR